ncbi:Formate dehydrogenase [Actinacidiphila bryophytorum]|uniref:Formate dehydrogenase n=1 Tax=Actinacidiphila bryophytorum TaxID=1436133 RepID=A0A9W4H2X4_9ACTN|nr:Formate dehydrogenase [Actinacidiphila bryophytorum]
MKGMSPRGTSDRSDAFRALAERHGRGDRLLRSLVTARTDTVTGPEAGIDLPALCHDDRLRPAGSCRTCLVRADGRIAAECVTPAAPGTQVEAATEELRALRRDAVEVIVSALPPRAVTGTARSELALLCGSLGIGPDSARHAAKRGVDDSHPYVHLDRDLCIACGRCVRMCADVQGTFALTLVGRGAGTVVAPGTGGRWSESDCAACGGCVDTCPTGAITQVGPGSGLTSGVCPPDARTSTTCGYCGVGCTLDVVTAAGEVAAVLPAREGPVNQGHACVKGRFAHGFLTSAERLTEPLVRRDGRLAAATWDEALAFAAQGMRAAVAAGGPDAVAAISSARFEAHPVVGARLLQHALRGARLIVADPRAVGLALHADVHLRPRPGTNVTLFHGLAHILLAEGLADEAFLRQRAAGLTELTELLEDYPPDRVSDITGVPAADLVAAARLYGRARRPAVFYGLGVTEHLHGTDGVRTLASLAILRGAVGTDRGCGVNPLRGQNNVQGASDMGALPDVLPGYGGVTDPDTDQVTRALEACPLVICNELFLSETARHADVVLPAASWLEKDGTFVNFDRRFQRVRPALPPPGQARSDFAAVHGLAAALGTDLGCPTPAAALAECAQLSPHFAGISHERLDRDGAIPWPCPSPDLPGEATLYRERFATPDGRAHLSAAPYLPPGEQPDDTYPLILVTGRRWAHYNSGSMTRRSGNLALEGTDVLDIHPTTRRTSACATATRPRWRAGTARRGSSHVPVSRCRPARSSAPSTFRRAASTASPPTTRTPPRPAPSTRSRRYG